MNRGEVGIVVPIYNNAEYLKECIDSVLIQDYKKIRIILFTCC